MQPIEYLAEIKGYRKYLDSLNIEDLQSSIDDLKSCDFKDLTEESIKEKLLSILGKEHRLVKNLFFNKVPARSLYYFRARSWRDSSKLGSADWYWEKNYDPNNRSGRLDYLDSSVFYTALSPGGALVETGKLDDD